MRFPKQFLLFAGLLAFCAVFAKSWAQEKPAMASSQESALNDSLRQLQAQIQQLQSAVREIKQEAEQYRAETLELRRELQTTRAKLESVAEPKSPNAGPPAQASAPAEAASQGVASQGITERVSRLEEDQQLLEGKIQEQYQTKVESASKYRVKLSGILLFNLFSNTGNVDHIEVPNIATATNPTLSSSTTGGSFGATFRQSQFGLEVYGPSLAGARTRADFVADFFGEFPETDNGWSSGALRLRTGTIRLDWTQTSVVAGVDSLFFSPSYPTSFASLAVPAFSYSGNLWGWLPQLRVEHRLKVSEKSTVTLSGGILDPLTGETPPNEFLRFPGAGESSRQPGYAARAEWSRTLSGQQLTIGVGGYYNRENWGFQRNIDGWAATTDWNVPLGSRFSVSGKFYGGKAIGGLGAGVGRSVVFDGPLTDPATTVRPLRSLGGWAQVKFKATPKLEFNTAAGQEGAFAEDVRGFTLAPGYFPANLTRNRSEFANFIYRPRSNLLLSTEFRALRTFAVDGTNERANQLNLMMGVLF
jgi:hypothetical protein